MTDEKIRELQKQIEKLNVSIATLAGDKAVPTFGEFMRRYRDEKLASSELRDSTKSAFDYQVRRNLPAFAEIPVDKFGNADWNAWVSKMKADDSRHKQITRFFNARKAVVEILNAAKERGLIERVPRIDNPDEKRNVGRVLTDREVWWLLRNTTYKIFRLFFYTMFKQGFRPREILKWERSMIRKMPDGTTWIEVPASITKTGRARLAPINKTVAKHVCRMMTENPNSRFVFQNRIHPDSPQLSYHGAFGTSLAKVMAKHPEMKPCVPYDFRRTFITRAMIKGAPPVYIGKLLDTSTKMIESTYAKDDAKTLEALVE
jgi:integrase